MKTIMLPQFAVIYVMNDSRLYLGSFHLHSRYRGFSPYATFGTLEKVALAKNRISKIFIFIYFLQLKKYLTLYKPKTKSATHSLLIIIVGYSDSIVKNFGVFCQRHKLENLKQMLTWSICFRI